MRSPCFASSRLATKVQPQARPRRTGDRICPPVVALRGHVRQEPLETSPLRRFRQQSRGCGRAPPRPNTNSAAAAGRQQLCPRRLPPRQTAPGWPTGTRRRRPSCAAPIAARESLPGWPRAKTSRPSCGRPSSHRASACIACRSTRRSRSSTASRLGLRLRGRVRRQQQTRAQLHQPGGHHHPVALLAQRRRRRRVMQRRGKLVDQGDEREPRQVDLMRPRQRQQLVQWPAVAVEVEERVRSPPRLARSSDRRRRRPCRRVSPVAAAAVASAATASARPAWRSRPSGSSPCHCRR